MLGPTRLARASARSPRVVFLNPGEAVEHGTGQHWQLVSQFMGIAARSFDMHLEALTIASNANRGTVIAVRIPLPDARANA